MYDEVEDMNGEAAAFGDFENWMKPVEADTKEVAFRRAILTTLVEMGGQGETKAIIKRCGQLLENWLAEEDYRPSNNPRSRRKAWEDRVCYVRINLIKDGLLKPKGTRGVWAISDLGRVALTGDTKWTK